MSKAAEIFQDKAKGRGGGLRLVNVSECARAVGPFPLAVFTTIFSGGPVFFNAEDLVTPLIGRIKELQCSSAPLPLAFSFPCKQRSFTAEMNEQLMRHASAGIFFCTTSIQCKARSSAYLKPGQQGKKDVYK